MVAQVPGLMLAMRCPSAVVGVAETMNRKVLSAVATSTLPGCGRPVR